MEDKLSGRGVKKGSKHMDAYVRFAALVAAKSDLLVWPRTNSMKNGEFLTMVRKKDRKEHEKVNGHGRK